MSNRERFKKVWSTFGIRELAASIMAAVAVLTFASRQIRAQVDSAVENAVLKGEIRVVKVETANDYLQKQVEEFSKDVEALSKEVRGNTKQLAQIAGAVNEIKDMLR